MSGALRISALFVLAGVTAVGCIGIDVTPKDAGVGASSDAGADAGIEGADCIPLGGATLCTATSMCPELVVDHDLFPNCGFRIRGGAVDIQCACDDALCPLGTPTTCAEAAQLLESQSELSVCAQAADGRCTAVKASSASTQSTTCDPSCRAECGNDPTCLKLCGC